MKKWIALLGVLAVASVLILLVRTPHSPIEAEPDILQAKKKWTHTLMLPSELPERYVHVNHAEAQKTDLVIKMDIINNNQQVGYLQITERYPGEDNITSIPGQQQGESLDAAIERLSKIPRGLPGLGKIEGMERVTIGVGAGYSYKMNDVHIDSQYEAVEFLQRGLHVTLLSDVIPKTELLTIAQSFHSH